MAELHGLSKMAKNDAQLFVKRITFIKKQLDVEPGPMRAISRDHSRTNRNGLKLDYLDAVGRREVPPVDYAEAYSQQANPFKADRRSPGAHSLEQLSPVSQLARNVRPMTPREKPTPTRFGLEQQQQQ